MIDEANLIKRAVFHCRDTQIACSRSLVNIHGTCLCNASLKVGTCGLFLQLTELVNRHILVFNRWFLWCVQVHLAGSDLCDTKQNLMFVITGSEMSAWRVDLHDTTFQTAWPIFNYV